MSNREPLTVQRYGANTRHLQSEAMVFDPRRLLRIVGRHWAWLIVPPIILAALGGVQASREESRFEASSMVVLQQTAAQDRLTGARSNALAEREIQTEERLLNGPAMEAFLKAELGSDVSFEAAAVEGTDLIELQVEAAGAEAASNAANRIAELYTEQRRERIRQDLQSATTTLEEEAAALERELRLVEAEIAADSPSIGLLEAQSEQPEQPEDQALARRRDELTGDLATAEAALDELRAEAALTTGDVRVAALAVTPDERISPNPVRSAILWLMLGLLAGLGLVWVRDLLDRRIRTVEDLSAYSGDLEFAGPILRPDTRSLVGPAALLIEEVADRFKVLASNSLAGDDESLVVQVTGVRGGEGSSFVAANLAATFAMGGWATAVVDADMIAGNIHGIFEVQARPGMAQLLDGEPLASVMQPTGIIPGLGVVAKGSRAPADASLHSSSLTAVLKSLSASFDVVVIDGPPILESGDAAVLAHYVDKTIVVAARNETTSPDLEQAIESVASSGGRLSALTLTEPTRVVVNSRMRTTATGPVDGMNEVKSGKGAGSITVRAATTGNYLNPRTPDPAPKPAADPGLTVTPRRQPSNPD